MQKLANLLARARSKGVTARARSKGKPVNMVDSNMTALVERIERVKMRERLERHLNGGEGWSYPPCYDPKVKRDAILSESLETVGLVLTVLGLTFASGTVTLLLVSLGVSMSQ